MPGVMHTGHLDERVASPESFELATRRGAADVPEGVDQRARRSADVAGPDWLVGMGHWVT